MYQIDPSEWSFDKIHARDPSRARRLEACGPPEKLVSSVAEALTESIDRNQVRLATVCMVKNPNLRRAVIQFWVCPNLYDWFFNARTGYRAQFWTSPILGMKFNTTMVKAMTWVLKAHLPKSVTVHNIEPQKGGSAGSVITIRRDEFIKSLDPDASKIWICEQLYDHRGDVQEIGFAELSGAHQCKPKLCISRWEQATNPDTCEKAEGLRAPFPLPENSWLELKGGFLADSGISPQPKTPQERACQIHERGWS